MRPIPRSIARIPLLRGLYRVVLQAYAQLTRGRYWVEERMGLRLLLDRENGVDRHIFLTGTWEAEHIAKLFELAARHRRAGEEMVFLDIGSHWGLYALLAHKTGLFERIVAFEPDPTNFAQLQANLFLNGTENAIETLQLAASNREDTFGLYLRTHLNRGATRVVENGGNAEVRCRAVRVDQQLDFAGKLMVIKMDVESHEIEAIDGLVGLLAKNRCVLQVEIWGFPDEAELQRRYALLEPVLTRHGLRCDFRKWDDHFFVPVS